MAEFLTTSDITARLQRIIREAEERLWLISPYLKINQRLKDDLEDKNRFRIDIRVIYGKSELQPDENNWLESMTSIKTSFRKDLHAKCYLNEKEALLTSMNLYEFSMVNNDEMGVLVSRDKEPDLYDDIWQEAQRIMRMSEEIRVTVSRVESDEDSEKPSRAKTPQGGFCIRCKRPLPAKPTQPYCNRHFRSWNRYKNHDFKEKHCHLCGDECETSMSKPACLSCYRKYRNILEFSAS